MFFSLIIFEVLSGSFTGIAGGIFSYLSISTHYESISRGVIDSKDLIYFCSITFFCLLLAETSLSKKKYCGLGYVK